MKWQACVGMVAFAAHHASQAHAATVQCQTSYASTSTSKVPTRTVTKTVDVTNTSETYTEVTVVRTSTTTYVSVVGKQTITVPTGPSFTPLTSAPTTVSTNSLPRRDAVPNTPPAPSTSETSASPDRSPAPSKYPQGVVCTSTSTRSHVTTTTDRISTTITTYVSRVSTVHVATSTAYAACADPGNLLTQFHGRYVLAGPAAGPINLTCDDSSNGRFADIACLDPKSCCEGAQRYNYSGFVFANYYGHHHCSWTPGYWQFNNHYDVNENYTMGNGPFGSGVFQP